MRPQYPKVAEASRLRESQDQRRDAAATIANRVFGKDTLKPIIACPPKLVERRWEQLNEVLVA